MAVWSDIEEVCGRVSWALPSSHEKTIHCDLPTCEFSLIELLTPCQDPPHISPMVPTTCQSRDTPSAQARWPPHHAQAAGCCSVLKSACLRLAIKPAGRHRPVSAPPKRHPEPAPPERRTTKDAGGATLNKQSLF
ncbi:hypothetical protein Q8A67_022974 [Cirrhinus molitorella]|uniref:Uncharacterized protein n=1 Tax=Cirrhinus molitorella TaxID=172907 RepID=A0AA88TCM4_9TELE|nr:hypothetical protein Q8A67_022974 [Cirrhinus molitorella]